MVAIAQIGSDFPTLWILPGGDGHAGWGADGRVDIKLVEAKSFLGKSVNVRSLGCFIAEAGKVAPSHIVDENQNEVGPFGQKSQGGQACDEQNDYFHFT
jgi:hypothetical protein